LNSYGYWPTLSEAMPYTATEVHVILLEFHSRATPVTETPSCQCSLNITGCYLNAGGHALDDGNQLGAMGFSSS
jgi:hypothetical protein